MATVAAIIIGNEILTGKFDDENGPYLIRRLRDLGADLDRIVVIPDVVDVIAREVREASQRFDWVITSGGVGPTHDDVTLESVAQGLGLALEQRAELVALIEGFGMTISEASLRMATVPVGTELLEFQPDDFPILLCGNVVVLPGVPKLFRNKFEQIAPRMAGPTMHSARLYTDEYETSIASRLAVVDEAHADVRIGSYPRFGEGAHKVMVTLESRNADALEGAVTELAAQLSLTAPVER